MSFKSAVCSGPEEKVAVASVGDQDSNLSKLVAYIRSLAKDSSLKVGSLRSLRKQGFYMMGMHHSWRYDLPISRQTKSAIAKSLKYKANIKMLDAEATNCNNLLKGFKAITDDLKIESTRGLDENQKKAARLRNEKIQLLKNKVHELLDSWTN